MNKVLLAILCLTALAGCEKTEFEKAEDEAARPLKWLYDANPDNDFEAAVAKKDYRFIGLYGYSLYVPGVPIKCLDYKKDIKAIEGTSDAVMGYEHSKLIAIAQAYAEHYNFKMMLFREESQGFKCNS
jgi:hypothetical protein